MDKGATEQLLNFKPLGKWGADPHEIHLDLSCVLASGTEKQQNQTRDAMADIRTSCIV